MNLNLQLIYFLELFDLLSGGKHFITMYLQSNFAGFVKNNIPFGAILTES